MYLKINKKKIEIQLVDEWVERIRSFRFKLDPIDYGLCFQNKRSIDTYFFCQPVDIIMTDKDNNIISIFKNIKSESRLKGNKNVYYTYIFPVGVSDYYEQDEKLKIIKE